MATSANAADVLHQRLLMELLSLPTAPFAEHDVLDFIERFCRERRVTEISRDKVGNLLVHLRGRGRSVRRPVCITAHTDHPGFTAISQKRSRLRAQWHGGVPEEYFRGAKVRFRVGDQWVRAVVAKFTMAERAGRKRVDVVEMDTKAEVPSGSIGMWDLPDPQIRGTRVHARACDDLVGVGAMLCCIDELQRRRLAAEAYFLFTRAEEVGFAGAIAAARLGTIPSRCYVVAMEASSERKEAPIGEGPILRVGDRATAFSPAATAYVYRVARDLAAADKQFVYQRKLMDGGTCESSAYCTLGYEATGLCVALGNYHNVDVKRRRIAPEYIDLRDFENVVRWFVELACAPHPYTGRDEVMLAQLNDLEKTYAPMLRRSVGRG